MIIYLHGLNSTALSSKAQELAEYCSDNNLPYAAPTLHHRPAKAAQQITELIAVAGVHTLVGSSMGGYYATWFCQQNPALRAVLVNPAVHLAEKLAGFVGEEQTNYHGGEDYLFEQAHLDELNALHVRAIDHPERYLLMVQTGDELLDYREATEFYRGARHIIEEGGDHSFVNFAAHLPTIADFAAQP